MIFVYAILLAALRQMNAILYGIGHMYLDPMIFWTTTYCTKALFNLLLSLHNLNSFLYLEIYRVVSLFVIMGNNLKFDD